jgi:hypothetical protein
MEFQETEQTVVQPGLRNLSRIQPEVLNRSPHRNSLCVCPCQQFFVETSHQRSAADKRRAKPYSLFLGKTYYFDPVRKLASLQGLQQCNCQNYAENSVESTGIRNRVEMRAHQQAGRG